jgi:hypothetical protein
MEESSLLIQIPVFSCIPCSSFHAHSMRYSVSILCAVPCAYKDSLYAWSQVDIPDSFQAMPGAASIISNNRDLVSWEPVCKGFRTGQYDLCLTSKWLTYCECKHAGVCRHIPISGRSHPGFGIRLIDVQRRCIVNTNKETRYRHCIVILKEPSCG